MHLINTLTLFTLFKLIAHGLSQAQDVHPGAGPSSVLSITPLQPQFFPKYHPQRVLVKYGPYTVPSMDEDNGMINFGGEAVPAPCTNCLVTFIHAGLEYVDGTRADANTGMWLHHTVWTNLARTSATCPKTGGGDRFFASGNERTPVDLTVGGSVEAGYEIAEGDVIAMGGELMNMRHKPREVVLSMIFEFVPRVPKGFRKVKSYWLDVGGCEGSSVPAREAQAFQYSSPDWEAKKTGRVVSVASHLHDGGVHTEIRKNGKVVCDSLAGYGECHDGLKSEERHIETLSTCVDVGKTKKGDEWGITSYYNTSMHAPMKNMDGSLEPVMGISLVYVALDEQKQKHKTLIFLGLGVFMLTLGLVVAWTKMAGRDWQLRRTQGVRLGEVDTKTGWSLLGERYRDEE